VTRPLLFGHGNRQRRLVTSSVTGERRRRALQIGAGRAEDARKRLATIVVATKLLDVHCARERFGTKIIAAKSLNAANWRQRFGTIVVTTSLANAVWNINPVQELVTEIGRGQWR
jgi:hypothetical protein